MPGGRCPSRGPEAPCTPAASLPRKPVSDQLLAKPDQPEPGLRALDAEDLRVSNLRLDEPSLNDVFLEKTGRSLEGAGDLEAEEK